MANHKKKKNTPVVFTVVFITVFLLVFIRHGSKKNVEQISVVSNKGFPKLSTSGDQLIAAESGGDFYIWKWSDTEGAYLKFPSLSEESALLFGRTQPVSLSWTRGNVVALNKEGKEQFQIAADENIVEAYLVHNQHQQDALFMSQIQEETASYFSIKRVDMKDKRLAFIYDLDLGKAPMFRVRSVAASANGLKVAVAGSKGPHACIAIIDINTQNLIWDRSLPDSAEVSSISFSSDGTRLFAGFEEGVLSMFNAQTGGLLETIVLVQQLRKTTNQKTIQSVTTSPQGKWVACVCDPEIFILDQETFSLYKTITAGHKIVTGLAFSPDETKLATSDLRASGTINILQIESKNNK